MLKASFLEQVCVIITKLITVHDQGETSVFFLGEPATFLQMQRHKMDRTLK